MLYILNCYITCQLHLNKMKKTPKCRIFLKRKKWLLSSKMAHLISGGEWAQDEEDQSSVSWPRMSWGTLGEPLDLSVPVPLSITQENAAPPTCKMEVPDQLKSLPSLLQGSLMEGSIWFNTFSPQGQLQLDGICLWMGQFLIKLWMLSSVVGGRRLDQTPLNPLWLCEVHIYSSLKTQFQRPTAQAELNWVSGHCEV